MTWRRIFWRLALALAVALPLVLCTVSWGESGCHRGCGGPPRVESPSR